MTDNNNHGVDSAVRPRRPSRRDLLRFSAGLGVVGFAGGGSAVGIAASDDRTTTKYGESIDASDGFAVDIIDYDQEVTAEEAVGLRYTVSFEGDATETQTVEFAVDDSVESSEDVTLEGRTAYDIYRWDEQVHDDDVNAIDYADGITYSGSDDGTVVAYDGSNGAVLWRHDLHDAQVTSVTYAGGTVYSTARDDKVIAYDAGAGEMAWQHEEHVYWPRDVVYADGVVYSGGNDYLIAYDAGNQELLWRQEAEDGVFSVVHRDGVVYWTDGGTYNTTSWARATDATTGTQLWQHAEHSGTVPGLAFGNGVLYSGDNNGTLVAYDIDSGEIRWKHSEGQTVNSIAYANGAVFAGRDSDVVEVYTEDGRKYWYFTVSTWGVQSVYASTGILLAGTPSTGRIEAFDVSGLGDRYYRYAGGTDVNAVAYGAGTVFAGGRDSTLVAYDAAGPVQGDGVRWQHEEHDDFIHAVEYGDGLVYSGDGDAILIAYDVEAGEVAWTHDEHEGSIRTVTYAKGAVYSGSSFGNEVIAYDVEAQEKRWEHNRHQNDVQAVTYGDDVVYSSDGFKVVAYDTDQGEVLWEDSNLNSGPMTYADGVLYAAGNETVQAYDVESESVVWRHDAHDSQIEGLAYGGGVVYSSSNHDGLIAYDADGPSDGDGELWRLEESTERVAYGDRTVFGGTVGEVISVQELTGGVAVHRGEFTWQTTEDDVGEHELAVRSEDDQDTGTVTVVDPDGDDDTPQGDGGTATDDGTPEGGDSTATDVDTPRTDRTTDEDDGTPEGDVGTDDDMVTTEEAGSPDEDADEAGDSSDAGVPGFGIGGTLTAIGGAAYLLKRRLRDDETEAT